MSEPLAATLLSGAVLAMLWAAGPAAGARSARWAGCRALLLGALALVRPGVPRRSPSLLAARRRSLAEALGERTGAGRSASAAVLLAGRRRSSSRPGRSATRSRSTASCRSRPAAARCCSPAPTCPRTAIPERVGARGARAAIPSLFAPPSCDARRPTAARLSRSSRRWPRSATRAGNRRGAGADGRANGSGTTSPSEPLEYAGFVATKVWRIWSHGPRDVMREPAWEVLHWAAASRFGLLGLVVLALAAALGGAAARRRPRSRSPRSAPCSSPRRGGCWCCCRCVARRSPGVGTRLADRRDSAARG